MQIPANGQGTAPEELNKLLRGRKVVSVRKEFVANGEDSFWAFCLEYLDHTPERDRLPEKVDYKAILPEAEFAVFSRLRALRKELADREAVPAYALFTNEQLAAMVRGKMTTAAQLGAIPGVGAARLEKYGAAFLALLQPPEARA